MFDKELKNVRNLYLAIYQLSKMPYRSFLLVVTFTYPRSLILAFYITSLTVFFCCSRSRCVDLYPQIIILISVLVLLSSSSVSDSNRNTDALCLGFNMSGIPVTPTAQMFILFIYLFFGKVSLETMWRMVRMRTECKKLTKKEIWWIK